MISIYSMLVLAGCLMANLLPAVIDAPAMNGYPARTEGSMCHRSDIGMLIPSTVRQHGAPGHLHVVSLVRGH